MRLGTCGMLAFLAALAWLGPLGAPARGDDLTPAQQRARAIFRELVEINTVSDTGDTARAAEAMAARLIAGGLPAADVRVLSPAPRKGNLVARLRGTGARKPILLLAHLDVVEARPQDWSVDPFKLVEKDGYLYGRGTSDDKFMAASFVSGLIRYREEGFRPERDIIVALETDEEILDRNAMGIRWLLQNHRDLIDAEFALNEGAGIGLRHGKPVRIGVQTSEKMSVTFRFEVTDRGGHSAVPRADNPIYRLAAGLTRLAGFGFPVRLNETTRAYFARTAEQEDTAMAAAIRAVLANPGDAEALRRVMGNAAYNAVLRTTCVATTLEGGHAYNALPQTARAGVNCRIMPGETADEVRAELVRALGDEKIAVTQVSTAVISAPSPLREDLLAAIAKHSAAFWPGGPIVPLMSPGATDGSFLRNAGIPTYGHSGLAAELDDLRAHGKDERVAQKSFLDGQEYLYRLVKDLAGGR